MHSHIQDALIMKILTTLLLFCFYVFQAHGISLIGSGIVTSSATCQEDIEVTTYNATDHIYNDQQIGQSFKAVNTGTLCEFKMYVTEVFGTPSNVKLRCGTSTDLSTSYYESDNAPVPAASTYSIWTFSSGLPMTSGTTYYCATEPYSGNYSNRVKYYYNTSSSYSDGVRLISTNSWTMEEQTSQDMYFAMSTKY